MTRIFSTLIFIAAIFVSGGLHSQHLQRYDDKVVDDIAVEYHGDKEISFDVHAIKARMLTKEGLPFSPLDFDADLKTLADEYDRIEPSIVIDDSGDLDITLSIWPRPIIRTITWEGVKSIKKSRLGKELGIKALSTYDREAFGKAFHKLKQIYTKKGFFEAKLSYSLDVDDDTNEVDITIDVDEGRSGVIKSITFHGVSSEEEGALLDMVGTKKHNLFTSWLSGRGTYNEDLAEVDRLTIYSYFQNLGYADATVVIDLQESKNKRLIFDITIDKGEEYTFSKITFSGNNIFDDEAIAKMLPIAEGDTYSPNKVRETVSILTEAYGRQGYIESYAAPQPRLHESASEYSVHFTIEEGLQYRIGLIKIAGNDVTKNKVILHETLLTPGEVFNITKLEKTEERLLNIGYFSNVNIYPANPHDENPLGPQYRDVVIEVEESSTGSISFAMGFSTADSLFVALDVLEKNFNIDGLANIFSKDRASLRGGGEYAHGKVNIGKKQRSYLLSWTKPFFMDTAWTVGFDVARSNKRYFSDDYDIDATSFGVNAYYTVNQYLTFGTNYRLKDTDVKVKNNDIDKNSDEWRDLLQGGVTSTLGGLMIYDSTNSPYKPTNGFRSRLAVDYTGLGGSYSFCTMKYDNKLYHPLWRRGVMKYRMNLNFIQPIGTKGNELPISERLLLGGEDNIRGYRDYSIGPKRSGATAQGGISLMLLSCEYMYPVFDKLGVFAFFDAGDVSDKEYHISTLRTSCGAGFNIALFPGAPTISLGYGIPLNPKEKADERRFFLNIGAQF